MSLTRRLAAGLPAVGVTALAALALAGSPAGAEPGDAARAGLPAVMATACSDDSRNKCVDGDAAGYAYGEDDADIPNDNSTAGADDSGDDDRGNPGYGGESPTPSPSETTPTAITDTVPPGGEAPAVAPSTSTTPGGGVSAGGTLPLTGAPLGATITVGAALVLGGGAAVWYTRRRREA